MLQYNIYNEFNAEWVFFMRVVIYSFSRLYYARWGIDVFGTIIVMIGEQIVTFRFDAIDTRGANMP